MCLQPCPALPGAGGPAGRDAPLSHAQRDFPRGSLARRHSARTVPSAALSERPVPNPFPAFRRETAQNTRCSIKHRQDGERGGRSGRGARARCRRLTSAPLTPCPALSPSCLAPPPASIPFVLPLNAFPSWLALLHPFLLPLGCFYICCPPFPSVFIYRFDAAVKITLTAFPAH